eukprot:CAMPEP_0114532036 /NCGR_PEP_ID=MMETSP0109-20121206/26430_1 /TAXON_ID=29199 /ORGANISM="Chlorarachnion reptans, Strain CCCM449" /LENGTH=214 /DNA_ID=CAMNT_0001715031 /DNA_START=244 /DNA_END=888 /DNA_ORIENTATION=+
MRAYISAAVGGYLYSRFYRKKQTKRHHPSNSHPQNVLSESKNAAVNAVKKGPLLIPLPAARLASDQALSKSPPANSLSLPSLSTSPVPSVSSSFSSRTTTPKNSQKNAKKSQLEGASLESVMTVLEYSDVPSTIALMEASRRIRSALTGKLKRGFWEMAFWRDRGVLLCLNRFSIPRTLNLPDDTVYWNWGHYLQAYYSLDVASRNPKHVLFGR